MEYGICHICGIYKKLTYEHVPPRKAFNSNRSFLIHGAEILKQIGSERFPWDMTGLKGTQMQRGIGFHTLCNSCNSNTGGWYGNAFIDFIFQGYKQLIKVEQRKTIELHYKGIFPNRIIKQILAMFCSINSDAFVAANPIFKKILLNKLQTGIPLDKYAIYI